MIALINRMTLQDIKQLVPLELADVNRFIRAEINFQHPLVANMTEHLLKGGGKQLRPLIVLLACKACDYQGPYQTHLAAMLEFFHTATLLHDDVIDESKLRRGQETANEIWGNKASVLVGDYLFTLHTKLLLEMDNLAILKLMTETANKIGHGEIKQLMNRHTYQVSVEEYFEIIEAKTSLLFAVSAAVASLITKQSQKTTKMFYQYGLHLGNAFQLIDDVLDYCSNPLAMGKNIGDDLADGKMTLPLIHAFKHASSAQKDIIKKSLVEGSLQYLPQVLEVIDTTGAIEFTKETANKEVLAAKEALQDLPDSIYKQALLKLADISVQREN